MKPRTIVVKEEDMVLFTNGLLRLVDEYISQSKSMLEELDWFGFEYDNVGEAWEILVRYGSDDVQELYWNRRKCRDEFLRSLTLAFRFHVITQDELSNVWYSFKYIDTKPSTGKHFEKWKERMKRVLTGLYKEDKE